MGRLDAIFAKLKQKQSNGIQPTTEKQTENNNNSKDLANLNQDACEPTNASVKSVPISSIPSTKSGSSRRKNRKSRPRNIAEFDDLEKIDHEDESYNYEDAQKWNINLRNGSDCDTDDLCDSRVMTPQSPQPLDLSSEVGSTFHDESTEDSLDTGKLIIDESCAALDDSTDFPLDLSVAKEKPDNFQFSTAENSEETIINAADISSTSTCFPPDSPDAKLLKDYANNTMNELLKIYGFGSPNSQEVQDKLQLTKYHVAQLAATANLNLIPNNLKPSSTIKNGMSHIPKKGIFTSPKKSVIDPQNGFLKFSAKPTSSLSNSSKLVPGKYAVKSALYPNKTLLPDYTKYLKRYNNGSQCGGTSCEELGYREHYHCLDCSRVYVKKEEMVRHFKWHKKREESLQHGFMRYSPMDNCEPKFGICTHNGRQTHYHCIQNGCDKVYISTSDVQMHANYHRKDSAIILEGFQRFRATEDCGTTSCQFYGQRTTHFHCRRATCNFTFKNKADMEKHKTYHQKDEILSKDGFKKFMKYENCMFINCKYTRISNHIHCIRPGCDYVLHSTAQLFSHKRKHERRDFESAYQTFRHTQDNPIKQQISTTTITANIAQPHLITSVPPPPSLVQTVPSMSLPVTINPTQHMSLSSTLTKSGLASTEADVQIETSSIKAEEIEKRPTVLDKHLSELTGDRLNDSLTLPIPKITAEGKKNPITKSGPSTPPPFQEVRIPIERKDKDETWKNYLVRYTANDPCNSRCQLLYKDHYHCQVEGCTDLFRAKDAVREHAKFHEQQDRISPLVYEMYEDDEDCSRDDCGLNGNKKHYHCNWSGCTQVIDSEGPIFNRLEHYRIHEYAKAYSGKTSKQAITDDDLSRRRRGRPPKYPHSRIPLVPKVNLSDDEITDSVQRYLQGDVDESSKIINGFRKFEANESCPDDLCLFLGKDHFHCARNRCYHATDRMDVLNLHAKDFHSFVTILDGFEFFDRNVNCRRKHCHNNKANRHFHCTRQGCDYSFVRHGTMVQHEKKHAASSSSSKKSTLVSNRMSNFVPIVPNTAATTDTRKKNVVKTSGTYYPLSGLNKSVPTLVSVSYPNMVSIPQSTVLQSSPLISPSPSAIVPINSFSVPGIGLVPQIFVSGNQALSTLVPLTVATATTEAPTIPLLVSPSQESADSEPNPTWSELRNNMHFTNHQNCCRPFCKLKKKDHFHCVECNQAFSDPVRLRTHIAKHGIKFKRGASRISNGLDLSSPAKRIKMKHEETFFKEDPEINSSSLNLNPNVFSNMWKSEQTGQINKIKIKREVEEGGVSNSSDFNSSLEEDGQDSPYDLSKWSGRKRTSTRHEDFIDSDAVSPKVAKVSSPRTKQEIEQVMEGFTKFKFNADCGYMKCAYKHSSTHYHCVLSDCGYGFSDRSRLVQHTFRHERIDKIMGNEFRQFRASVHCSYEDCEFCTKSTHFHCLKCSFSCADSSKVSAHRKHHLKLDNISSKGFVKYVGSQDCEVPFCAHSKKQTHYHCTFQSCNYAVLGPAQMAPHKLKHSNKASRRS